VDGVSIRGDGRSHDLAFVVLVNFGRVDGHGTAGRRLFESRSRIVYPQRNVPHAVAVAEDVVGDGMAGPEGGGEDKADLILLDELTRPIPHAGFGAAVPDDAEAEDMSVVEGRLLGVAHVKLNIIGAIDGEEVLRRRGAWTWSSSFSHNKHEVLGDQDEVKALPGG